MPAVENQNSEMEKLQHLWDGKLDREEINFLKKQEKWLEKLNLDANNGLLSDIENTNKKNFEKSDKVRGILRRFMIGDGKSLVKQLATMWKITDTQASQMQTWLKKELHNSNASVFMKQTLILQILFSVQNSTVATLMSSIANDNAGLLQNSRIDQQWNNNSMGKLPSSSSIHDAPSSLGYFDVDLVRSIHRFQSECHEKNPSFSEADTIVGEETIQLLLSNLWLDATVNWKDNTLATQYAKVHLEKKEINTKQEAKEYVQSILEDVTLDSSEKYSMLLDVDETFSDVKTRWLAEFFSEYPKGKRKVFQQKGIISEEVEKKITQHEKNQTQLKFVTKFCDAWTKYYQNVSSKSYEKNGTKMKKWMQQLTQLSGEFHGEALNQEFSKILSEIILPVEMSDTFANILVNMWENRWGMSASYRNTGLKWEDFKKWRRESQQPYINDMISTLTNDDVELSTPEWVQKYIATFIKKLRNYDKKYDAMISFLDGYQSGESILDLLDMKEVNFTGLEVSWGIKKIIEYMNINQNEKYFTSIDRFNTDMGKIDSFFDAVEEWEKQEALKELFQGFSSRNFSYMQGNYLEKKLEKVIGVEINWAIRKKITDMSLYKKLWEILKQKEKIKQNAEKQMKEQFSYANTLINEDIQRYQSEIKYLTSHRPHDKKIKEYQYALAGLESAYDNNNKAIHGESYNTGIPEQWQKTISQLAKEQAENTALHQFSNFLKGMLVEQTMEKHSWVFNDLRDRQKKKESEKLLSMYANIKGIGNVWADDTYNTVLEVSKEIALQVVICAISGGIGNAAANSAISTLRVWKNMSALARLAASSWKWSRAAWALRGLKMASLTIEWIIFHGASTVLNNTIAAQPLTAWLDEVQWYIQSIAFLKIMKESASVMWKAFSHISVNKTPKIIQYAGGIFAVELPSMLVTEQAINVIFSEDHTFKKMTVKDLAHTLGMILWLRAIHGLKGNVKVKEIRKNSNGTIEYVKIRTRDGKEFEVRGKEMQKYKKEIDMAIMKNDAKKLWKVLSEVWKNTKDINKKYIDVLKQSKKKYQNGVKEGIDIVRNNLDNPFLVYKWLEKIVVNSAKVGIAMRHLIPIKISAPLTYMTGMSQTKALLLGTVFASEIKSKGPIYQGFKDIYNAITTEKYPDTWTKEKKTSEKTKTESSFNSDTWVNEVIKKEKAKYQKNIENDRAKKYLVDYTELLDMSNMKETSVKNIWESIFRKFEDGTSHIFEKFSKDMIYYDIKMWSPWRLENWLYEWWWRLTITDKNWNRYAYAWVFKHGKLVDGTYYGLWETTRWEWSTVYKVINWGKPIPYKKINGTGEWEAIWRDISPGEIKKNSWFMDSSVAWIEKRDKLDPFHKARIQEIRKKVNEVHKDKTWKELILTDEQVLTLIAAHTMEWELWNLKQRELSWKTKKLAQTIEDPEVRKFLLEAGFSGKMGNIFKKIADVVSPTLLDTEFVKSDIHEKLVRSIKLQQEKWQQWIDMRELNILEIYYQWLNNKLDSDISWSQKEWQESLNRWKNKIQDEYDVSIPALEIKYEHLENEMYQKEHGTFEENNDIKNMLKEGDIRNTEEYQVGMEVNIPRSDWRVTRARVSKIEWWEYQVEWSENWNTYTKSLSKWILDEVNVKNKQLSNVEPVMNFIDEVEDIWLPKGKDVGEFLAYLEDAKIWQKIVTNWEKWPYLTWKVLWRNNDGIILEKATKKGPDKTATIVRTEEVVISDFMIDNYYMYSNDVEIKWESIDISKQSAYKMLKELKILNSLVESPSIIYSKNSNVIDERIKNYLKDKRGKIEEIKKELVKVPQGILKEVYLDMKKEEVKNSDDYKNISEQEENIQKQLQYTDEVLGKQSDNLPKWLKELQELRDKLRTSKDKARIISDSHTLQLEIEEKSLENRIKKIEDQYRNLEPYAWEELWKKERTRLENKLLQVQQKKNNLLNKVWEENLLSDKDIIQKIESLYDLQYMKNNEKYQDILKREKFILKQLEYSNEQLGKWSDNLPKWLKELQELREKLSTHESKAIIVTDESAMLSHNIEWNSLRKEIKIIEDQYGHLESYAWEELWKKERVRLESELLNIQQQKDELFH